MKKFFKIALVIILILIFGGIIFRFFKTSEDLIELPNNDPARFTVTVDGREFQSGQTLTLPLEGYVSFDVAGTAAYQIAVLPNVGNNDFYYRVGNGALKQFSAETLTTGFKFELADTGFTLDCNLIYNVESVLKTINNTTELYVEDYSAVDYPFLLRITTLERYTFDIPFKQLTNNDKFTISPGVVEF